MSNRSAFEASVDTRLLYQRLMQMQSDEILTHEDLSSVIGRDVRTVARSNLYSARRMAERDGVITAAVTRVGIKRLTNSNAVQVLPRARERVRRAATRGLRMAQSIPFSDLSMKERVELSAEQSHLGAIKAFATDKITKRIESKVDNSQPAQIAIAKTLKVFEE